MTPITEGDDLAVAQSQSAAMAKAKTALREAVDKAIGEATGFRAVACGPQFEGGPRRRLRGALQRRRIENCRPNTGLGALGKPSQRLLVRPGPRGFETDDAIQEAQSRASRGWRST